MTSEKDLGTLSGSYALNSVDASELPEFVSHLAQSPQTRDEVTELSDTAVLLGLAVAPVAPSAQLKRSILDQLDSHPQDLPAASGGRIDASESAGPASRKAAARWYRRPVAGLIAAAAAVVILAGGGVLASNVAQNHTTQQAASQLEQITSAVDSQRASVPIASGGTATVVWSNSLSRSALLATGLAPLPGDRVYELWYIGANGPRSAGTFTADDAGTASPVLTGKMALGDKVAVTVEPHGGSTAPTTDPLVVVATA
jgi:anti-sigma-K factor RskA